MRFRSTRFALALVFLPGCADDGGAGTGGDASADATMVAEATLDETLVEVLADATAHPTETSAGELITPAETMPAETEGPCGFGTLKGVVCAPSGLEYVADATISVDAIGCNGESVHAATQSGPAGAYTLTDIPSGTVTVRVTKGAYETSFVVQIVAGQTKDISGAGEKRCFGANSARIAVVEGTHDRIGEFLDQLGFAHTDFSDTGGEFSDGAAFLASPTAMADFDIIFLNCSKRIDAMVDADPTISDHLRDFVMAGGSFYASDWAYAYEDPAFPSAIDFHGTDTNPAKETGPKYGLAGTYTGTVTDPALAAALGKATVSIAFNYGTWAFIEATSSDVTTHVTGDLGDDGHTVPLIVSFKPGPGKGGRVVFTSFHNEEQATEDMGRILKYFVLAL